MDIRDMQYSGCFDHLYRATRQPVPSTPRAVHRNLELIRRAAVVRVAPRRQPVHYWLRTTALRNHVMHKLCIERLLDAAEMLPFLEPEHITTLVADLLDDIVTVIDQARAELRTRSRRDELTSYDIWDLIDQLQPEKVFVLVCSD